MSAHDLDALQAARSIAALLTVARRQLEMLAAQHLGFEQALAIEHASRTALRLPPAELIVGRAALRVRSEHISRAPTPHGATILSEEDASAISEATEPEAIEPEAISEVPPQKADSPEEEATDSTSAALFATAAGLTASLAGEVDADEAPAVAMVELDEAFEPSDEDEPDDSDEPIDTDEIIAQTDADEPEPPPGDEDALSEPSIAALEEPTVLMSADELLDATSRPPQVTPPAPSALAMAKTDPGEVAPRPTPQGDGRELTAPPQDAAADDLKPAPAAIRLFDASAPASPGAETERAIPMVEAPSNYVSSEADVFGVLAEQPLIEAPIQTGPAPSLSDSPFGDIEAEMGSILPSLEEIDPERLEALQQLALESTDRGHLAQAAERYGDLLDLAPEYVDAYLGRGRCYLELGDYGSAMSDFQKAEDLAPGNVEPVVAMGDLFFARKEYNRAIECFDAVLDQESGHAMARCRRGISHYYRKNYRQAFLDLQRAYNLDPNIPNIRKYVQMAIKKLERQGRG